MRNKSVFLLLACVCGTIAAIGVSQWMQAQSTGQSDIRMVEIFVTAKAVDVAEEITAEKIRLEQWPADRVPTGATSKLEELQGKFARQRFYAGEPVMPVKLMNEANSSSVTIPKGFSVVSMKADAENAVANLVRPGDRVDVMAYFTKSDIIPESMAKTVLRGIRVFAVDGRTQREDDDENNKTARTVSLLISKDDAEAWTYASELGKVRLSLGNPGDYQTNDGGGSDAGDDFLRWLADYQKAQQDREEQERDEKKQLAGKLTSTPAPKDRPNEAAAGSDDEADGFTMLKLSGDRRIRYEWGEGRQLPTVVGAEDGPQYQQNQYQREQDSTPVREPMFNGPAPESPTEAKPGQAKPGEGDYRYLNGAESPFFEPPAGPAGPGEPSPGAPEPGEPR